MKKKIIIISISILLVLGIILNINSTPKNKIYLNKNKIENNNKSIAIYLENSSGNYDKTTTFPIKESGYVLNTSKSVCNGNTNISWNNEEWGIELDNIDRENTKCYLYFDKGKTIDDIIATLNPKTEIPTTFENGTTADEGVYIVSDPLYGGTSYYWRGLVTNNYVKFADKCWRILRVNGDGSIRLIYDGTTCHANGSNSESIAVTSTAYNTSNNQSNYVGWTYSGTSQRTTSGTASNAKTQLESWYSSNIIGANVTKVAQGKYCNDRNAQSGNTWVINGNTFYYAAYKRIITDHSPSLACPSGDVYTLNVGLITVDEVMYAGGTNKNQTSYYLYNGQQYWTMSPYYLNGDAARVFIVSLNGYLTGNDVNKTWGLRPVINLKSDTLFNNGNGTLDNPYEVL